MRNISLCSLIFVVAISALGFLGEGRPSDRPSSPALVDPSRDLGVWEGWGSSLAWWAHAVGGSSNADFYADLIYTTRITDGCPGLGLNIVRYNVGGGGINQSHENKGPNLKWYMDVHGYWVDPRDAEPMKWNWSVDQNQRSVMLKARERGANLFEMFSDSPMWWMNSNRSTAGSDSGGDCLLPADMIASLSILPPLRATRPITGESNSIRSRLSTSLRQAGGNIPDVKRDAT